MSEYTAKFETSGERKCGTDAQTLKSQAGTGSRIATAGTDTYVKLTGSDTNDKKTLVHNTRNKKQLVGKNTIIPSTGTHGRKQMMRAHTKTNNWY